MVDIECRGSACRIKKCASELLTIKDFMDEEDDGWEVMGRHLHLKSTFLFCDFNQVISHASDDKKKFFTDLANRLFYYIQELDCAIKTHSVTSTRNRYNDASVVLQEVIAAMPGDMILNQRLQ